ncbi:class I SAM-dependent methyltransferase [Methylocaldum szegediense]|jgi:predicted O-methyltransferase YrrM|uniref:Class I SAM-dependent methyltransferase n=1 Tax=Methylocaldum szegediense TaxID=73780 RepID=A0ABM9I8Y2_9GAMM|nr:class I SAM-dependent methyltransferase [Methylocaldum szegediense]CAI8966344.1 Class I SAM-dependent methyltransferase [Methylocaldum szegediense]
MESLFIYLNLSIIALLLFIFSIVALCFYKVRKIHLASYQIVSDLAKIRRETDSLFNQIQALLALERKLGLPEALPPMRGWAGSPDFLLNVANEILVRKPKIIMECSSGVSTIVAARCAQINGIGHVYSLEHDPEYSNATRKLLAQYGLSDWATVLDAPLVTKVTATPWYDEEVIPQSLKAIEILIIDGPPSSIAPLARYPALPRLRERMAVNSLIIADDTFRPDEQEMLRRWQVEFPEFRQRQVYSEKGCTLLERDNTHKISQE